MTAAYLPRWLIATPKWCCGDGDAFVIPKERIMMTGEGYVIIQGAAVSACNTSRSGSFSEAQPSPDIWRCKRTASGRNPPLLLRAAARAGRSMGALRREASTMLAGAADMLPIVDAGLQSLPLIELDAHRPVRCHALLSRTKTIGVASSHPDRRLATGVETIARKNFSADAARLLALVPSATAFALGLPLTRTDRRSARAIDARLCPQPCAIDPTADCALHRRGLNASRLPRT